MAEHARQGGVSFRLAIGVTVALGVLAGVWLLGELGYRRGFAELVHVRPLRADDGGGLTTGVNMLISMPGVVIRSGVERPGLFMLGLVLIGVPAVGLSVASPRARGGSEGAEEPGGPLARVFSRMGVIAAMLCAAGLIWWTVIPTRTSLIGPLPFVASETPAWLSSLRVAAGLDVLAATAAAVWAILVMRLGIPGWMRGLAAPASFFALVVASVGMAASNGAVAEIQTRRPVVLIDGDGPLPRLILGYAGGQVACLRAEGGAAVIELLDPATKMTVAGSDTIGELLEKHAPRPGP